jgi:site-specific DNA recombinase
MNAIIYCRVSTEEQIENYSLGTQQRACEEYCRRQNINVLQVFIEEGESAKTADRPKFQQAITYCRENKSKVQFFVVYKVNRFARNQYDHWSVKVLLSKFGVSLRSATETFDESAVGKLTENMLATVAQFDNDQKAETTATGMKAALREGRWPFSPPLGYVTGRDSKGKPLLSLDPVRSPHIRRAFEQFATGNFTKKQVLRDALTAGLRTNRGKAVPQQTFDKTLQNKFYAGFVSSPKWKIEVKGLHEPLISEGLFNTVQACFRAKSFPLRRI